MKQTYDHVALAKEIEATYRPPFTAEISIEEMLIKLNRDVDVILSRQNSYGDDKTPEQFCQDKQHDMDKMCVEMLFADRGLVLTPDPENEHHWIAQEKV